MYLCIHFMNDIMLINFSLYMYKKVGDFLTYAKKKRNTIYQNGIQNYTERCKTNVDSIWNKQLS